MKILRLPFADQVLEAELRQRPIMADVELVLRGALNVYAARIPAAVLRLALRSVNGPDAELRIAKPVWTAILRGERFPSRLIKADGNLPRRRQIGLGKITNRRQQKRGQAQS